MKDGRPSEVCQERLEVCRYGMQVRYHARIAWWGVGLFQVPGPENKATTSQFGEQLQSRGKHGKTTFLNCASATSSPGRATASAFFWRFAWCMELSGLTKPWLCRKTAKHAATPCGVDGEKQLRANGLSMGLSVGECCFWKVLDGENVGFNIDV